VVPPQPNGAMAMTNDEHAITLTDAELNEVVKGLTAAGFGIASTAIMGLYRN
jgi:hypothetical protein